VDAGPKGVVFKFHNATFANPAGLIDYIAAQGSLAKLRPDHTLVLKREWPDPVERLKGTSVLLREVVRVAEAKA
jgi:transcription-repair coupling factor (superfamily II helicase)